MGAIRVRMAVHTGTPFTQGSDYFGPAVNRTARILSTAHGGQILMSEYAASWTDSTAAEFAKYDLNGDGFITPKECLDAQEAMKKK